MSLLNPYCVIKPLRLGWFLIKEKFSEFLERIWRSGNEQVGLSGLESLGAVVSSKVELAVEDPLHEWEQVGSRPKTNSKCQTWKWLQGCSDVEAHKGKIVDGVDCSNKVYMPLVVHSCDKPTCELCFRDWARRGSQKIDRRLVFFSKRYGEVFHVVASPDPSTYGLPYEVQFERHIVALKKRYMIGGCSIVHAVRKDKRKFSIHFHVLGFFEAGYYDKCRRCVGANCYKCDGFEGLTRRLRKGDGDKKGDGFLIKVLEKRNKSYYSDKPNIGGTAFYQLTHASVLKGVERFHVWRWWGVCAYNKGGIEEGEVKPLGCLICGQDLHKHVYTGSRPLSVFKRGFSLKTCLYDAEEDGVRVFREMGGEDMRYEGG